MGGGGDAGGERGFSKLGELVGGEGLGVRELGGGVLQRGGKGFKGWAREVGDGLGMGGVGLPGSRGEWGGKGWCLGGLGAGGVVQRGGFHAIYVRTG